MDGLLLVVFDKDLETFHVDELGKSYSIKNEVYNEYEDYDFTGFYDWLRLDTGKVIGLRYSNPDGFDIPLLNALTNLPYLKFTHEKIIEVYFDNYQTYIDEKSNDQDFGICKLYVSSKDIFALLLDISNLTNDEYADITVGVI